MKHLNDSVILHSSAIQEGIRTNKQVSFYYCQWDEKKKLIRKYQGKLYQVSPIGIIVDHENYYLAAYNETEEERKYLIDKMDKFIVSKETRMADKDYSLMNFIKRCKKLFGMFGANEASVSISCKKEMNGILIDQFGRDIIILAVLLVQRSRFPVPCAYWGAGLP